MHAFRNVNLTEPGRLAKLARFRFGGCMSEERKGHCLCGAVRFRTSGRLPGVTACHCSQCRRQSGHHYAAIDVRDDALAVEGGDNVTWFRASDTAKRGFCRTCGSALFWKGDENDYTSVMAGAFDQPTGLTIGVHIFCDDKGDYYEIADGAPRFAQGR
jgi:hypothetical protein